QKKEAIPGNGEFPLLKPVLEDHSFPHNILTDQLLKEAMSPERLQMIRKELQSPTSHRNEFIQYKVPWHGEDVIVPYAIDFIFSHVVLQHIDEIEEAAVTMDHWLKPGGFVSHIIDYRSLGYTKAWNGHWTIPDWEWKIMVGGRKFSVNRNPHSYYIDLFKKNQLKLLYVSKDTLPNDLSRNNLAQKFRNISDDDLSTTVGYFVGQKSQ
ncbi:MAG: class I SAM-dependent methyltransferase, partial [Lentimicrobium sp.]|nr:class I SAM-dependent methyltransferase [Lentimicrobium sp.]